MPRPKRTLSPSLVRRGLPVVLALAALAIPLPAALVESWYSRGAYVAIQRTLTPLSNLAPIAYLDLAVTVVILAWLRHLRKAARATRPWPLLRDVAARFAVFTAVLYLAFLFLWGLNYRRLPLERKLIFDSARITRANGLQLARQAVMQVNAHDSLDRESDIDLPGLRSAFDRAQRLLGASTTAIPGRPKLSLLAFYFRWAAIDGMTDPYFLEIIVNPDVLPLERPFVIAHEWAHLAGYANESEANFVAWLTCVQGDARARYSGWLTMYVHLSNALADADRRELAALLGPAPRADLAAISARLRRSAPVVREAAREVYDSYLKANRVPGGIDSYDAVVRLVLGTTFDNGWAPRLK